MSDAKVTETTEVITETIIPAPAVRKETVVKTERKVEVEEEERPIVIIEHKN